MLDLTTIELIKQLLSTHSPREQLQLILEFNVEHPVENTAALKDLLEYTKQLIASKSQQGKDFIARRNYARKANTPGGSHSHGKYFSDYDKNGPCSGCDQPVPLGPAYRHKVNGKYQTWHTVCVPHDQRSFMERDPAYIRDMKVKK